MKKSIRTRRTRKGKRTTMTKAAKTSWALSELPEVANEEGIPAEQPAPASRLMSGFRAALSLAIAVGAYVVLYGVLEPLYHSTGAAFRALVPLGVEMIMGGAVHQLLRAERMWLASGAALIILACGWTEVDAARAMPEAAKRDRIGQALSHPAQAEDVHTQGAASVEVGRKGNLQLAQNRGAALALQAKRDEDARQRQAAMLDNASQPVPGEGRLAIELAILGAIGSSCFLPLLEDFLRACRSRK